MIVETFTVGPLGENAYLVADEGSRTCVLIDPGAEAERLIGAVERSGAALEAIWLTHAHFDHIGAIAGVVRRWSVPVLLHPLDEPLYRKGSAQAAYYGIPFEQPPDPDGPLAEGDVLHVGSLAFDVWHAPGHAPGHVVIHGHGVAFVGDCLFAGSIGRTDLPLSDPADLQRTLARLTTLSDVTRVLSGHGPATDIATERRTNPFLNGSALVTGSSR